MNEPIDLNARGVRLFHGRLYNHDYLWFSSNEISRVSTTQPFVHNYALCYALSLRSYGVYAGSSPCYVDDPDGEFNAMPVYATPARAAHVERTTLTFNAVNDLSLTTGESGSLNTPTLGKRVCINLQWEPLEATRPRRGYECYIFTFDNYTLPGAFRLGKKGAPVRARWQEITNPIAAFHASAMHPSHAVNPLDVSGRRETFDIIFMPPHTIMRDGTIADDWFVQSGHHCVHVPRRVLLRMGVVL